MTPSQPSLFSAIEGRRRKAAGMSRAVAGHAAWLTAARIAARDIAERQGQVTADDLWAAGIEPPPGASHNVFGSVFMRRDFVAIGLTKSKRPGSHANLLRVWALRGAA